MNQFYHYNLIHAHQFGQSFVIDCGYEKMLSGTLLHNLYEQIAVIYNINRQNKEPFKLHLCEYAYLCIAFLLLKGVISKDGFPSSCGSSRRHGVIPKEIGGQTVNSYKCD